LANLREILLDLALELDKAIELGANAAYPLIFNVPPPEGGVDWKGKVGMGWKVTKAVARETARVVANQWIGEEKSKDESK
jgi:hypothetical protein